MDRFPDSKIVEQKPGMCKIEMDVNDGYGMRMWLMSQGQMVKIIHPLYMRQYLLDEMKAALAHYDRAIVEQHKTENLRLL
ncbi:WCX domain-containing protein [Enterococcus bulliens]